MTLQEFFSEGHYKSYIKYLVTAVIVYLLLRGCLPGRDDLPQEVHSKVQEQYVKCLGPGSTPSFGWWSQNAPEQYECGQVEVKFIGEGTIPGQEQAQGVERAICIQITIQTPYWTTEPPSVVGPGVVQSGEVRTKTRTVRKVTVLQDREWQFTQDEDAQDAERWEKYACPAAYEDKIE